MLPSGASFLELHVDTPFSVDRAYYVLKSLTVKKLLMNNFGYTHNCKQKTSWVKGQAEGTSIL